MWYEARELGTRGRDVNKPSEYTVTLARGRDEHIFVKECCDPRMREK